MESKKTKSKGPNMEPWGTPDREGKRNCRGLLSVVFLRGSWRTRTGGGQRFRSWPVENLAVGYGVECFSDVKKDDSDLAV